MEKYTAAIDKYCESINAAPSTVIRYKKDIGFFLRHLGENVFDLDALVAFMDSKKYAVGTRRKYLTSIMAVLRGMEAPASQISRFDSYSRSVHETVNSLAEKMRKQQKAAETLVKFGDYKETMLMFVSKAEQAVMKGTRPATRDGTEYEQKIQASHLHTYMSFAIDCKIRAQGPPPRSDFCNVYSSKEVANGGSYYDGERGVIVFTSRVKDPHGVKENPEFDVSGIKDELSDYIFDHQHPKLLNKEMSSEGYVAWIGGMTEKFCGERIGVSMMRKLFWNTPEMGEALDKVCAAGNLMGHTPQTAKRDYRLDSALVEKENDDPAPKRAKLEKTALEKDSEGDVEEVIPSIDMEWDAADRPGCIHWGTSCSHDDSQ